jgi:hypothetical protein
MTRRIWLPMTLAALALIGGGCSTDAAGGGDATGTSGGGSGAGSSASQQEQAVKFSECMRENGVPNFPDPDPSGDYRFGVDVSPGVFAAAVSACKELEPPGALSSKRTPEEQEASLRFAQCVRENGVEDFPDPVEGEPLIDTTKIPSTDTPEGMTILNAATEKCGDLLGDAIGGAG